jgi:hypothetical protein
MTTPPAALTHEDLVVVTGGAVTVTVVVTVERCASVQTISISMLVVCVWFAADNPMKAPSAAMLVNFMVNPGLIIGTEIKKKKKASAALFFQNDLRNLNDCRKEIDTVRNLRL